MGSLPMWAKAVAGAKEMPVPAIAEGKIGRVVELERRGQVEAGARFYYSLVADVRLFQGWREFNACAARTAGADRRVVTACLSAGVPMRILSPTAKPRRLRTLILVAPALAFAARFGALRLRAHVVHRHGLDAVADAVDVEADLVANRDVGDGSDFDVGRAGMCIRRQVGLRARLADRSHSGYFVLFHAFRHGGIGGAVSQSDLLADHESG